MRQRFDRVGRRARWRRVLLWLALLVWLALPSATSRAADASPASGATAPAMDSAMRSAGWLGHAAMQLENEATADVRMMPDAPAALAREWRSFDREGSALGALVAFGWVALAAGIAIGAEKAVAEGLGRGLRRAMRTRLAGPTLGGLLLLLVYDMFGLAVFAGVFVYSRHWLMPLGVTLTLVLFSANVLIRWRIAALVIGVVLRPSDPIARLIDLPDDEARRLARFLSAAILAVVALIGVGRMGLDDVDGGAPHIIGLIIAVLVCGIYALIVYRARAAAEAFIRGHRNGGVVAAVRSAVARAWLPIGMTAVGGLMVFFVFGLSLGLLSYFQAVVATLAVLFLLLVLGRLAERSWHDADPAIVVRADGDAGLVSRTLHRFLRAIVLFVAAMTLVWVWIDAIELPVAQADRARQSAWSALVTLWDPLESTCRHASLSIL